MPDFKKKPIDRVLIRKIKRDYDYLFFKKDPIEANIFLLLAELANDRGEVKLNTPDQSAAISLLMLARFDNLSAYQLPEGAE